MAGILETNGANIALTAAEFASYDIIRYSAEMPNAPVTLTVTDSTALDLSSQLGNAPATIYSASTGSTISSGAGGDTLVGNTGKDTLFGNGNNDTIYGNAGQDYLDGGAGDDYIDGGTENDFLSGGAGADILLGGAGNDQLYGGADADTLYGGAGVDSLSGGTGDDTYIQRSGEGVSGEIDTLYELPGAGTDTLKLVGVNPADVAMQTDTGGSRIIRFRDANGVTTMISVSGSTTANGGSDIGQRLERVEFDDGTVWDFTNGLTAKAYSGSTLGGTDFADTLSGDATLYGYGGDDTLTGTGVLHGGAGNDTLSGNGTLYGDAGNDSLTGGSGANALYGGDGNDVLDGGSGDDTLSGGTGDDTYILRVNEISPYNSNDAVLEGLNGGFDTLRLIGVNSSDAKLVIDPNSSTGPILIVKSLKANGGYAYVNVLSTTGAQGGSDVGQRVEQIVFDDGTVWDLTKGLTLTGIGTDGRSVGTDFGDVMTGAASNDRLYGYGGADTIDGGNGDDTISGGAGDDVVKGGVGNDALYGDAGNDRLYGDAGNDTLDGGDDDDLLDGGAGDDTLRGGSGVDRFLDVSGNNTANGEFGDDQFFSVGWGSGLDTLTGSYGNDTYVLATNLASPGTIDVVTDFNKYGTDVVNLSNIAAQFVDYPAGADPIAAGYARFVQSGADTLLQIDADGSGGGSFVTVLNLQGVDAATLGSANLSMATIVGPNAAPQASDDVAVTPEDIGIIIDVLANDSDAENDALTIISVVQPNNGAVQISNGKLSFVPAADFFGETTIEYVVADSVGNQSTASVKVTVQPVNDAPTLTVGPQSEAIVEAGIDNSGGAVDGWQTASIQFTKADVDIGDVTSYDTTGWTAVGGSSTQFSKLGTYGTVVLDVTTGLLSYTLDNAKANGLGAGTTATDAFDVTVKDSAGATVTKTATFVIDGTNDAPTLSVGAQSQAVVESGVTPTNGTVYGWQTAKIQLTKADPDTGDAASFDLTGWAAVEGSASQFTRQGTYGSVVLDTATGLLSYTLDNTKTATNALKVGATANDAFAITVKDTAGGVVTKTASFVINGTNDAPTVVAGAQSQAIVESGVTPTGGTVYGWQTAKIQLTRTDPEGDATSYDTTGWTAVDGSVTQFSKTGLYGSVIFDSATGLLSYTLDNTKANGIAVGATATDGFAVTVKDALGGASTKTVSFVINGTNDAPTLAVGAQSQAVVESGVTPTNGTVYGWQTAKIQLTKADPDAGDVTSYDTTGWTAVDDSATQFTKTGTYGSVVLDTATGLLSYTLDNTKAATNALKAGTTTSDAFSVTVKDLNGGVVTKTASFVVTGTNDAPTVTFGAQSQAIVESGISASGGTVYGWQTAWLQVSKSDPEGDATSYDLTGWTAVAGSTTQFSKAGLYGSAVFDTATSRMSYTLDNTKANGLKAGATATDSFALTVKDLNGGASTRTANFAVTGTNDLPVLTVGAQSQAIIESGLSSTGGTIYGWATAKIQLTKADPDGDATSYDTTGWTAVSGSATQFTKLGTYGSVVLDTTTGLLSYTLDNARPATNALEGGTTASDNFTVTLKDGLGGAVTKVASFAIQGTNDGVTINGTSGADTIAAGSTVAGQSLPTPYADTIYGNGGNDSISGLGGKDILDGGDGIDAVSYSDKTTPVVLTLNGATFTTVTVGGVAEDQIRNFETIVGGYGSDRLTGDDLATIVYGLGGDDILDGAGGDDRLVGGLGMDTLTGGSGRDSFAFDSALGPSNLDTITDFSVADDVVQLSSAIFTALSPRALAAADFVLGSATNTAQNIIYAPTTGALSYDSDGTGSAASVQFATLAPNLALTAANFRVT